MAIPHLAHVCRFVHVRLALVSALLIPHAAVRGGAPEHEVLDAMVKAYNGLDVTQLENVVHSEDLLREWKRAIQKFRSRGQKPLLTLNPVKTSQEGEMTIVEAVVSLSIDGRYEQKDAKVLLQLKPVDGALKIVGLRDPGAEAVDNQWDMVGKLFQQLKRASGGRSWGEIGRLFDADDEVAAGLTRGDEAVFDRFGIGWLYDVTVDPGASLGAFSASFEGRDMVVRCQIHDKENRTTAIHVLYQFLKQDPQTGETTYRLRPPTLAERRKGIVKEIRNFWSAASHATQFGYVQYTREWGQPAPKVALETLLPHAKPEKGLSLDHRSDPWFGRSGKYVLPLWDMGEKYGPVGGIYYYPMVPEAQIGELYAKLEEWRGIKDDPWHSLNKSLVTQLEAQGQPLRPVSQQPGAAPKPDPPVRFSQQQKTFLLKTFDTPVLKPVLADSVAWLEERGLFDRTLPPAELGFWQGLQKRADMDAKVKQKILSALSKHNLDQSRETLVAGLANRDLAMSTARAFAMKDPEGLRKVLVEWMDDPEKRGQALALGRRFRKDREFLDKVAEHLPTAKPVEIRHYLPYLLDQDNRLGFAVLADYVAKNEDPLTQGLLFSEMMRCGNDPRLARSVRTSVENLWKKRDQRARFTALQGLSYLCFVKDLHGIRFARRILPEVEKDKALQGMYQMYMSLAARKPLMDWTACKGWVMSLK